jgi:beta-phosphoglucomutase
MPWPDEAIRAVVFDMDGVLVDSTALHREVWESFVASCPWPELQARAGRATGRRSLDVLTDVLGEKLTVDEIDAVVTELHADFLRRAGDKRLMFKGVEELLKQVSDAVPIALATSAPAATVDVLLRGARTSFSAIITAEECGAGKPDPEVYQRACLALQVHPQHVLAVEDAPAGVLSARAAGCAVFGLSSGAPAALLEAGAVLVSPDVATLARHLLDQVPRTACADGARR